MSSINCEPNLIWHLSNKIELSGAAGHNSFVASVFVIKKLSKTVLQSSYSDELPALIVIVFTPAGDAELTFEKRVLDLRF